MKTNALFSQANKKHRGVALLIVMLIMALMATVAATMSSRMFVNFNRAESQFRSQQAYWYALSVEKLVELALKNSFGKDDAVTLSQPWAVRDQVYPIEGWTVKGSVFDEQACFNLNALRDVKPLSNGTNPQLVTILQRLIELREIDANEAETAAASTWEYIDPNDTPNSAFGVEDSEYEGKSIPHLTANGFLSDATEWRAINGVSRAMYQKVSPFLCAIPSSKFKINVNTLEERDAPLLAAIFSSFLSIDMAKALIKERDPIKGWESLAEFFGSPILSDLSQKNRSGLQKYLDVKSQFFEADVEITLDDYRLRLRSLLQRSIDGNVKVVRRRFGGSSERYTGNTSK